MLLKECTSQILLQITLFGVFTPSLGVSAVSSKPCVESLLAFLSSLHFLPYEHQYALLTLHLSVLYVHHSVISLEADCHFVMESGRK